MLFIGQILEQDLGRIKFICFFLVSGMGGILLSVLCTSTPVVVSSSNIIFGFTGAYISCLIINWSFLK